MAWSTQAIIIMIVYTLAALALGGLIGMKGSIGTGIGIAVATLLTGMLLSFDTNCLTENNCNIWSWVRSIIFLIQPLALIGLIISGTMVLGSPQITA